jgi:hypothetical protein
VAALLPACLQGGCYMALGRTDDTMNLGGGAAAAAAQALFFLFLCFSSLPSVFPPGRPLCICARAAEGFVVTPPTQTLCGLTQRLQSRLQSYSEAT